ncbi:MAG TPA: methyltransferase [Actinomycetes bacterium]
MDAVDRLDWLTRAYRVGQIIRTAALYGICDVLADGPMPGEQVAARVGAAQDPMRRLLRALVAIDVLTESDGLFSNGTFGDLLRQDHPDEMRDVVISRMRDTWWRAWGSLPEAVRTGESAYVHANGRSFWVDLAEDPDAAATFNALMSSGTEQYAASLVASTDLTGVSHLVDVGGGKGATMAALLAALPAARGTVFDLPAGLIGADGLLTAAGVRQRIELVAGDFFESVPAGGDVYLLRRILHDWPDDRAVAILKSCRDAIADQQARLFVSDMIMPERAQPGPAEDDEVFTLDMHMLVLFGARERSVTEFEALSEAAGFRVDEVLKTSPEGTIVASPV